MLFPVILDVRDLTRDLTGKSRLQAMSQQARNALFLSSALSGLPIHSTPKDHRGAPLPDHGVYWSVSHKREFVASVCSVEPVGIDIEHVHPRGDTLMDYIADEKEWGLFNEKEWFSFFRIFTAKESALKLTGEGLRLLGRCRIMEVSSDTRLVVAIENSSYQIEQHFFSDHLTSVAFQKEQKIAWNINPPLPATLPRDSSSS